MIFVYNIQQKDIENTSTHLKPTLLIIKISLNSKTIYSKKLLQQIKSMLKSTHPPLLLICISFLIISTYSYTLLGPYKLQPDITLQNISSNSSIIFDFKKQIVNNSGVLSINNVVSILACSVVDFSYTVQESTIGFLLKDIGVNRRQCVQDQVGELISRMNKVAFTTTIANSLLFMAASGRVLFRLVKVQTDKYINSLAGAWQAYQIQSLPSSTLLKANNSMITLCNGNAQIDYGIPQPNKIQYRIKNVKNCSQNDAINGIYNSRYIRSFNDQLWFYSRDVDLLMKWNHLGELPGDKEITYYTNIVKIKTNDNLPTNVTNIGNNLLQPKNQENQNRVNNENKNQIKITSTENKIIVTNSISNNQKIDSQPTKTIETKPTQISQKVLLTIKPISNIQIPVQLPPTIPTTNSNSLPQTQPDKIKQQPNILLSIKKQDIISKWYLIGSQVETMMLIAANRIMIYGDCGVWYTLYNSKDPIEGKLLLSNTSASNTTPTCLNKNNPLQTFLSNLSYITIRLDDKKQKYLKFWNKDNVVINEWANYKQKKIE